MFSSLRKYFISGLLVWVPIVATVFVIRFLVRLVNDAYHTTPARFQLDNLLGAHIPGLGIIITVIVIILTGMFAANFLGKKIMALGDKFVGKIPLVRTIYLGLKQILETMFNSKGKAFRKVLLVEYPRKGLWSIAFQTGEGSPEVNQHISNSLGAEVGEEVVTIFIPTTPNPTSGFLMMVPKKDVVELKVGVDQALKFVISLGVVQPGSPKKIKDQLEAGS